MSKELKIIFLHHSTGKCVLRGSSSKWLYKAGFKGDVAKWFGKYNKENRARYNFKDQIFPKKQPYGWKNYPYDYYNIWVKHAGDNPFMGEPTLEILSKQYDIIVWKHCYPVSKIIAGVDSAASVDSELKTLANYKLQYVALNDKMKQFPSTKFIVWTGAALTESITDSTEAKSAKEFFNWVINVWDEKGDNIYIWDFRQLETNGGLYLLDDKATSPSNPHPSEKFSSEAAPLFCKRIVDVIEGRGDTSSITGE